MQVVARWNKVNVQKVKDRHGIRSDRQLALRAGISPQTLSTQLVHDKPAIDVLAALSTTYSIAVDSLILVVPKQ